MVRHRNNLSSYGSVGRASGLQQDRMVCRRNRRASDCWRSHCNYRTEIAIFGGLYGGLYCGRYWDRTSDPFHVKEVRYRCANRPYVVFACI